MRLWLRLYTEVLNDPKVQKLDGNSFKFWINLLCCAKEYSNDGVLPDVPGIAFHLRIKEETTQKYLEKMIESGLVDHEANTYYIHSWNTRQYESDNDTTALDRKRRERDRKKNVTDVSRVTSRTCLGNVTPTEQIPEQIPEIYIPAKQKKSYGKSQLVHLADKEYGELIQTYGDAQTAVIIDKLDSYKLKNGKKYKSDMGAIRSWVLEAISPTKQNEKPKEHKRVLVADGICPICKHELVKNDIGCRFCNAGIGRGLPDSFFHDVEVRT